MARILKWQEKVVLACAALLFSVTSGLGLGSRDTSSSNRPSSSRVVSIASGKSAAGVELMVRKPYVRLVRASLTPVSLPLAAGAFVTTAGATGTAASAADGATAAPDCTSGGGGSSGGGCYTVYCSGSFAPGPPGQHTCHTCGYGTCGVCC